MRADAGGNDRTRGFAMPRYPGAAETLYGSPGRRRPGYPGARLRDQVRVVLRRLVAVLPGAPGRPDEMGTVARTARSTTTCFVTAIWRMFGVIRDNGGRRVSSDGELSRGTCSPCPDPHGEGVVGWRHQRPPAARPGRSVCPAGTAPSFALSWLNRRVASAEEILAEQARYQLNAQRQYLGSMRARARDLHRSRRNRRRVRQHRARQASRTDGRGRSTCSR